MFVPLMAWAAAVAVRNDSTAYRIVFDRNDEPLFAY
jgi:hypothetical protein